MIGDVYMKALLINGSPRTNGCTFTVLTELKNTLEKEGIDAEIIHVGHKDIGNGNVFCAASMFFTIVPIFMITMANSRF